MTEALIERAQQLISTNRHSEAERELRSILSQEPENIDAIVLMAICQSEQNNMAEAHRLIQSAISREPANSNFLQIEASFLLKEEKYREAEKYVRSAISFNPSDASLFGLLAYIKIDLKEWNDALASADAGLAIDPENMNCLNARTTALFKLNKKEDAYSTIQNALEHDPENDFTHANTGWGLLEKGDYKKALEHFREALRLNPHSQYAKAGLVEGLKARYWIYRIFLRYQFWIGNMKGGLQWAVILGFYFGSRLLNIISESNPSIKPFLTPIIICYTVFAISTWVISPLSNLFLRLNAYGKYALTEKEIKSSNFVGVSLVVGLVGSILYLFNPIDLFFLLAFFGLTMMIPLSSMLRPSKTKNQNILIAYTSLLALVGVCSIGLEAIGLYISLVFTLYLFGLIAYQFVANALIIK
jgi:tetratricopeptide (TPR) repeat protein